MSVEISSQFGGQGGQEFIIHLQEDSERIVAIQGTAGDFVDAFQIISLNAAGQYSELDVVGGSGGQQFLFELNDGEYLTGISGRYAGFIDQIQFHTNLRTSPIYGGAGGQKFSLRAPAGAEVVGFAGRADWYIDAIAIVTRPLAAPSVVETATEAVTKTIVAAQELVAEKVADVKEKAAEVVAAVREAKPKDLQKIEGIGPKISHILVENGIPDLAALADTQVDSLKGILKDAGSRYKLADPTTWPEQAKVGVDEGMKALKAFQAKLKGGRRK